jgi:predicted DNA-binding protein
MTAITMAKPKVRMSLYLPDELKAKIEKLAELESRTLSNYIESLCKEAVDKAISEGKLREDN